MARGADDLKKNLLTDLTADQKAAVTSEARRLLVVAGAGSGKTEVTARRIAWDVGVRGTDRDAICAFTFTERAAEEMKFRIRRTFSAIPTDDGSLTLGRMYVGTIHGFCLQQLRELAPSRYQAYDVLDEGARVGLVDRHFWHTLAGGPMRTAFQNAGLTTGYFAAIERFLLAYDLLNEYALLDVLLSGDPAPGPGRAEGDWCALAQLKTDVGASEVARTFATTAARYNALLHSRRFLDFSTAQAELLRLLQSDPAALAAVRERFDHVVVDEIQDTNEVQTALINTLIGDDARFTGVGDHRQAIYAWRGGRVDLMGALFDDLKASSDGAVVELETNFRSTPRIIDVANEWSATIDPPGGMSAGAMTHGRTSRTDEDPSHLGWCRFPERADEAAWIADSVKRLVANDDGAAHDTGTGGRGLRLADVAVLLRSATDARTYGEALQALGIPVIFRGSDLFARPEVLLFVGALANCVGVDAFFGRQLQTFIDKSLGCDHEPAAVVVAAADELTKSLPVDADLADRLLFLGGLLQKFLFEETKPTPKQLGKLKSDGARQLFRGGAKPTRVFPQTIFHAFLEEAGVAAWDAKGRDAETVMFHLGALSSLVLAIETPGWTTPFDLKSQIIGLTVWGPKGTRLPEAELLTEPDAVSVGTVHSAKGLQWPVVFLADVCARRFPSSMAKRRTELPLEGGAGKVIDPARLADTDNLDGERRLMYVGLTRAERFLFVTASGAQQSKFMKELEPLVAATGGRAVTDPSKLLKKVRLIPGSHERDDQRLVTSFSDLRYHLECPHDFYLRKILGFAPTIDQAFGYGRGVHNLMREVHADPDTWAALAEDPAKLKAEIEARAHGGLFFLRYTTGEPLERMRAKAVEIVTKYVETYAHELRRWTFEPEREFETLLEEQQVLISGAIDVIRRDDPPTVTLIDFKSGEAGSDLAMKLTQEEMQLQVSLYGIAAKAELEYEPEKGLVRYLDEPDTKKAELLVNLDEKSLQAASDTVTKVATEIRARKFHVGPPAPKKGQPSRCGRCDFRSFCGLRRPD